MGIPVQTADRCPPHDLLLLRTEKRAERKAKDAPGHTRKMDLVGRDVLICQKCGQWQIVK